MTQARWIIGSLLLSAALVACGPGESSDKNNTANNETVNNAPNNGSGSVTELLPDGYDRVEAGRFSPDGTDRGSSAA